MAVNEKNDVSTIDNFINNCPSEIINKMEDNSIHNLIKLSIKNNQNSEVIKKLIDCYLIEKNENKRKDFYNSLSIFQSSLKIIKKTGKVDFVSKKGGRVNYNFVKIEDIALSIQPMLSLTSLSYTFEQEQKNNNMIVRCIVAHKNGYSQYSELSSIISNNTDDMTKNISATLSYLRRYTLISALSIITVSEEDNKSFTYQQKKFLSDQLFSKSSLNWLNKINSSNFTLDNLLHDLSMEDKFLTNNQIIYLKSNIKT